MTREDAKVFLDNLKICINEHPIVADWLVEIADRKTEPSGYKMKPVEQTEPQQVTGKLADTVIPTDIERGVWDYKGKGKWAKTEPQTEIKVEPTWVGTTYGRFEDEPMKTTDYCDICKRDMCEICVADVANPYCVPSHYEINYEPKTEPQTDCAWK